MTSKSIPDRLASLTAVHKQTVHLIHRLQRLPVQPGFSTTSDADALKELTAEIHQKLNEQEDGLELLRQETDSLPSAGGTSAKRKIAEKDQEENRFGSTVAKLTEDLKSSRSQFRKAQLQARRNADSAKRKEKELLLSRSLEVSKEDSIAATLIRRKPLAEKLTQDELLVNASSDVTTALRRTHQLMQAELSRSHFAQETLDQSTAALFSLSESYTSLDTLLSSSRALASTLFHSQKSDTWYLETAFYVLIVTISWLTFRRIFYGPLWWLVWLPIKLLWRFSITTLIAVGILGGATGIQSGAGVSSSLIIKPSATGGLPTFDVGFQAPSVVVGGGNRGGGIAYSTAITTPPGETADDMSEQAQAGARKQPLQRHPPRQPEEKPERSEAEGRQQGEGRTNIEDISEEERRRQEQIPRNPKKRMFEAPVEQAKRERGKDEL